jgi:thiol-disulfide isomerase/thioredoxin
MSFIVKLFTLLLLGISLTSFSGCFQPEPQVTAGDMAPPEEKIIYAKNVSASEAVKIIPSVKEFPTVLFVSADLCSDCKLLKPKLEKIKPQFKDGIDFIELNLNREPQCAEQKTQYHEALKAYAPVVTPTLIFIQKGGNTQNIMVGDQPADTLLSAFTKVALPEAERPKKREIPTPQC